MIFIFIVGGIIGFYFNKFLIGKFDYTYRRQVKAIRDKFGCQNNDFTYYYESDDYYILSIFDKQYVIKFSLNRPTVIVYCELIEN